MQQNEAIDYTCECPVSERATYRVTHHDGGTSLCRYCEDCAEMGRMDWNGETAAIEEVAS